MIIFILQRWKADFQSNNLLSMMTVGQKFSTKNSVKSHVKYRPIKILLYLRWRFKKGKKTSERTYWTKTRAKVHWSVKISITFANRCVVVNNRSCNKFLLNSLASNKPQLGTDLLPCKIRAMAKDDGDQIERAILIKALNLINVRARNEIIKTLKMKDIICCASERIFFIY